MKSLRAACAYFGVVFGAGFVLGTARTLWLVPRIGERDAELAETPLMLAVSFLAARLLVRRLDVRGRAALSTMGFGALLLLVAAEAGVVLLVRRQPLADYAASRDPVSGSVYVLALVAFALAPLLVAPAAARRGRRRR